MTSFNFLHHQIQKLSSPEYMNSYKYFYVISCSGRLRHNNFVET